VLVYPGDYVVPRTTPLDGGGELRWQEARVGETWSGGSMALSWPGVMDGGRLRDGPRSVVMHECAHLFDSLDGDIDGVPPLPGGAAAAWIDGLALARERFETALDEDPPVQVAFNGGTREMSEVVAAIGTVDAQHAMAVSVTSYPRRDFTLVDVNAAGATKGPALADIARHLGVARHEGGAHRSGRGAGQQHLDALRLAEFGGHHAAVRLGDHRLGDDARLLQRGL
jgi:hypothetical protein